MKNPNNLKEAFSYIADCCLATVDDMAMKKSRPKNEYKRQISIAQYACDWMEKFEVDPKGTRAEDIIGIQTVENYAKEIEKKIN